jgi:hypothetical protein
MTRTEAGTWIIGPKAPRNQFNCSIPWWKVIARKRALYIRTPWFAVSYSLGYEFDSWRRDFYGVRLAFRPMRDRIEGELLFASQWSLGFHREM